MPGKKIRSKFTPSKPISLALPAEDQTAFRLMKEIKSGRLDPKLLTREQRRACLVVMAHGAQTSAQLGAFFGVAGARIRQDVQDIRKELGMEIRNWTNEELVGQLAAYAERFTAALIKDQDWSAAWAIQRDFVRSLKELGLAGGHEGEGGVRITIESLTKGATAARQAILDALDPRLTGEVVDAEVVRRKPSTPALPLDQVRPDAPAGDVPVELVGDTGPECQAEGAYTE